MRSTLKLLTTHSHLFVIWIIHLRSASIWCRCRRGRRRVKFVHGAAFCIVGDDHLTSSRQKLLQCHVLLRTDPVLVRKLHTEADNKAAFVEWAAILWHAFVHDASYITWPDHFTYNTSYNNDAEHRISLHFNGHFPGGPGLADTRMSPFWILLELRMMKMKMVVTTGAKTCKAPVKSPPTTNQHPAFHKPGAFLLPNQQCWSIEGKGT